jgi:hypothetical protein
MRVVVLALLVACQGKDAPKPAAKPPADAAIVAVDWAGCEAALKTAATSPATRRAQLILDACQPCGDWAPLLHWNVLPGEGGPARLVIENRMLACGYCEPEAKQRFLGALDNARGSESRVPWRVLGEVCRERVGALPDARYMSAPYYALDRIARAAGARPALVPLLAAIDLPLPALSVSGAGYELPTGAVASPTAGPTQITITLTELRVGPLPHATLGPTGIAVVADGDPYPGTLVPPGKLGEALAKITGPIALIAPTGLPARRIAEVVDAAGPHDLRLAVVGPGSPEGWIVPGTIPMTLQPLLAGGKPRVLALGDSADPAVKDLKTNPAGETVVAIDLGPDATTKSLAKLLGALAFQGAHAAMLTSKP